jgi:hypothetical protein
MEDVMIQQRAIGTITGQRQVVTIARFLMPWHTFLRGEHAISSSLPFSTAFDRILPCFAASILCPSAMVRVASWHRQIPDEKHVGFLPCARSARQAHLPETTRLAMPRRYLIPDLGGAAMTNVNFPITFVVELPRRIDYTCLIGFSPLERNTCGKIFVLPDTGGDQLEQPGPEQIRFQLKQARSFGTLFLTSWRGNRIVAKSRKRANWSGKPARSLL